MLTDGTMFALLTIRRVERLEGIHMSMFTLLGIMMLTMTSVTLAREPRRPIPRRRLRLRELPRPRLWS